MHTRTTHSNGKSVVEFLDDPEDNAVLVRFAKALQPMFYRHVAILYPNVRFEEISIQNNHGYVAAKYRDYHLEWGAFDLLAEIQNRGHETMLEVFLDPNGI